MTDAGHDGDGAAARTDELSSLGSGLGLHDQLPDVLASVRAAAGSLLPFDRIGVALLEDSERIRSVSIVGDGAGELAEHLRSRHQCSDKLWPTLGGAPVNIRDSAHELDRSYDIDRRVVESGSRSVLVLSLEVQRRQLGLLWFEARGQAPLLDNMKWR